jgi:hypothetical protein
MTTEQVGYTGTDLDVGTHWVSKQCERGILGLDLGPLLNGVVKFGAVWDLIWLSVVVANWEEMSASFMFSWLLVLSWVNIAPYLIWLYDEVVMPEFLDRFSEITAEPDEFSDLGRKYSRIYSRPHIIAAAFWGVAIVLVAWAGKPVVLEQGMTGLMPLVYIYAVYIGTVLAGPGFMGPIVTILFIRSASRLTLTIQPLHPDQLGGLSNVGYYSIRTTLLFSSGSLVLPLAFRLTAGTSRQFAITTFVFIYIVTILGTFFYPTLKINRTAAGIRDEVLNEIRTEYKQLQREVEIERDPELSSVSQQLKLQHLRKKYEDYKNVRLYPLQVDMIIQLVSSVLLPLVLLFVEVYVINLI